MKKKSADAVESCLYIHILKTPAGWLFCPSTLPDRPHVRAFSTHDLKTHPEPYATRKECLEAAQAWWVADCHVSTPGVLPDCQVIDHE